ncbi:hypothetical protein GCM10023189_04420 [Nibrella saemangeumensis]|uniref:Uncharacterized protein n=1 Tax=Nibrella saemangeumensis TaxID=1084526 RepID=A0ABP8MDM6_9BACT
MPEQEKSIGRKILSFFVKEDPDNGSASAQPNAPVIAGPAAATGASLPGTSVPGTGTPNAVNQTPAGGPSSSETKFIEHFAAVLEKTNPQGPDYFEFRETLRNLSNLGLGEEKQYQAAWASFKAMGGVTDVGVLTNTANQYLSALNADRESFRKSVNDALAERVGGLQNEQKQLQTVNENLAKQILELQNKINANNERLGKIGAEIDEQSQKINQNRQTYEVTYNTFVEQIKADLTKIANYLK